MKKSYKRYRGGYRSAPMTTFPRFNPKIQSFKSYIKGKMKAGIYNKLGPIAGGAVLTAGKVAMDSGIPQQLFSALVNAACNKQSPIVPGVGVLPTRPGSVTKLQKTSNKGTGITRTYHTSGKLRYNTTWQGSGQKYINNITTASSSFLLRSNGNLRGVASDTSNTYSELQNNRIQMFSGTGATNDPAQSVYLSQQGSDYTGEIFLSNSKVMLQIQSATNANAKFRIYEIVAKVDSTSTNVVNPITAWNDGINAAYGVNTSTSYASPGIYPGHSQLFRTFWDVEAMYDVELQAGAGHIHTSTYNYNTAIPNCRFVPNSGTNGIMAGVTRSLLIVLDSAVAHDSTNPLLVGFATTSLDIIVTRTHEFYGKAGNATVINTTIATDGVTIPTIIADSDFTDVPINN